MKVGDDLVEKKTDFKTCLPGNCFAFMKIKL